MVSHDISKFVLTNRLGRGSLDWKFYGRVLVTTTVTKIWGQNEVTEDWRNIYRRYGDSWCYVDDGVYLPSNKIDELVRSWEAKNQTTIEEADV